MNLSVHLPVVGAALRPPSGARGLLRRLAASPATRTGSAPSRIALRAAAAAGLIAGTACLIRPEALGHRPPAGRVHRNIREGRPGEPLRLRLQVVEADGRPVADRRVDLWHCDAASAGFGRAEGRAAGAPVFLHGTQVTDATGVVEFDTIVPGRGPGQPVQAQFRVFLDGGTAVTGRLLFPAALTDAIHATFAAYAHSQPELWSDVRAAGGPYAWLEAEGPRYRASLVIGLADDGPVWPHRPAEDP